MPYRVDVGNAPSDAAERLIDLGALDVELSGGAHVAALMPDRVTPAQVAAALGTSDVATSTAIPRDAGSVWVLTPPPLHVGRAVLRLIDSAAFGTGLHPTTALCLEALQEAIDAAPDRVLDVGTGSGVLALAALSLGVPRALGIDIDEDALHVAGENARRNGLDGRLQLAHGGPDAVAGTWPLVLANVLAAPLIEMAPGLVRRVGRRGQLILSGIPASVEPDVRRAYERLGMQRVALTSRGGWVALGLGAGW